MPQRRRSGGAGQLRIAAGALRGRKIQAAPGSRPTQARVREAIFSRWATRVVGEDLLELFCGGGAVSFEALSRGVERCFLVDVSWDSIATVRANQRSLGLESATIESAIAELPDQWRRVPKAWPTAFGLIVADPPYGFAKLSQVAALGASLLRECGEFALEHGAGEEFEIPPTVVCDRRTYGDAAVSFLRASDQEQG